MAWGPNEDKHWSRASSARKMTRCTSKGPCEDDAKSSNPLRVTGDARQRKVAVMTRKGSQIGGERERWIVSGLWSASVIIVVAGFVLRACGSFLHRPDLRLAGVVFIASGVVVAVIGWFGEKFSSNRPSNRA